MWAPTTRSALLLKRAPRPVVFGPLPEGRPCGRPPEGPPRIAESVCHRAGGRGSWPLALTRHPAFPCAGRRREQGASEQCGECGRRPGASRPSRRAWPWAPGPDAPLPPQDLGVPQGHALTRFLGPRQGAQTQEEDGRQEPGAARFHVALSRMWRSHGGGRFIACSVFAQRGQITSLSLSPRLQPFGAFVRERG